MSVRVVDQLKSRQKARIDALTLAIHERGFDAAVEFAFSAIDGTGEVGKAFEFNAAVALLEHFPNDPVIWTEHNVNTILREHCARVIANGQCLSSSQSIFAARALIEPSPPKRRGRPSDLGQRMIAVAVLRDLTDAGVPVYHNGSTDAAFYAVDAVAEAMGIKERRLRDWWQQRDGSFGAV